MIRTVNFDILPETVLAYVAGLFDGEGTVVVYWKDRGRFKFSMHIANTDSGVIRWLLFNCGGSYYTADTPNRSKTLYTWAVNGDVALAFAKAIHPYAVIKKQQLEMAMYFREHAANVEEKKLIVELLKQERHKTTPALGLVVGEK